MTNNNYLSNQEPRLPTRVKRALNDLIVKYELQAARVANGIAPGDEIEDHFAQFLGILEDEKPHRLTAVQGRMAQPMAASRTEPRYRAFANVDLRNFNALNSVDLVTLHKPSLNSLNNSWVDIPPEVPGASDFRLADTDLLRPQTQYRGLKFHLAKVKCLDETDGFLGTEWGEDEIYCSAVAIDENGESSRGGLFKVGDFDDGDVRTYRFPGKQLQYFNIHEGGDTFPKIYTVAVSLVEHDFGNLSEWYDKLLNLIKDKVTEYLAATIGAAVGSSLGPLGSLIGAAIGWAVGKVIGLIKGWLDDEDLGTATIRATINSYSGNWIGSGSRFSNQYTRDYRAHGGHYRIYWRAELVA